MSTPSNPLPQLDPDTAAKIAAILAARNGGSQPSVGATPAAAPNFSTMAESAFNNPMGQPVQSGGGVIDPSAHPMLAKVIQTLANAAGAYGWTAMPPQERVERTELNQRKAQVLAEAAARQQQLGLEQQRVGYEGERVGIERGRAAQEAQYQTGMLGETQKRTSIEQQRADQEHQYQTGMLDKSAKQLEEDIRFHRQQGTLEQNRINLEKNAQDLMKQRMQIEEDHFDQQIRMQGLTFNRQVAEDERKQLHTALDEWAKSNSWSTWLQGKDFFIQQHQAVDAFIDDKLRQVTGPTPFPSAAPKVPITVTGMPPRSQNPKPAYFVNGKWYDNPQGTGAPLQ